MFCKWVCIMIIYVTVWEHAWLTWCFSETLWAVTHCDLNISYTSIWLQPLYALAKVMLCNICTAIVGFGLPCLLYFYFIVNSSFSASTAWASPKPFFCSELKKKLTACELQLFPNQYTSPKGFDNRVCWISWEIRCIMWSKLD